MTAEAPGIAGLPPPAAPRARRRREPVLPVTMRWVLLIIALSVALVPFLWMIRTAIGPSQSALNLSADPVPPSLDLQNFRRAWDGADLGTSLVNGVVASLGILVLQLVAAVPAAYAFACLRFRGRGLVFGLVLATLLVPPQVIAVPNYITVSGLGLADSRLGLIIPFAFATSAFSIFLLRQYMTTIPDSILEAARMDGLGTARTLWRVVIPLSMPAIATAATFTFLVSFNEYLWPLLVARSPGNFTPPVSLAVLANASGGLPDFASLCAGAMIVSLPTLIVFLIAQRRLSAGLSGTGAGA